jgi:hypothetical protein
MKLLKQSLFASLKQSSSVHSVFLNPVFPSFLCVCAALVFLANCSSSGAANTGGGGGGGGGGSAPVATLSPKMGVTFPDPVPIGMTGGPAPVMLTNTGNATLNITNFAIAGADPGDFKIASNTCGATLDPNANCTIEVTFSPTQNGIRNASFQVTDNAGGSPQSIPLTGTGTGTGNGPSCTGSALPQPQTNVTSQLSFVAPGVTVMQLTANGCNRFYYFDAPAYSSTANQIIYTNFVTDTGNTIMSANPDGTGAAILSSQTGAQPFVSPDGTLVYYDKPDLQGATPGGEDIFGGFLSAFTEFRITNLDAKAESPLPVWEISPASPDPAGGQDIAFSPDTVLHLVHVLPNGTSQPGTSVFPATLTLTDPENAGTFHRLRLNPKFPNILIYKRNASSQGTGATPELWLVDLNSCTNGTCPASINMIANIPGVAAQSPKGDHFVWSPDGLDLDFLEPDLADSWLAMNVVNPNGTLNLTNGNIAASQLHELGPFGGMTADFCVFPHDWPTATILGCMAGPASTSNAKTAYLMSTDGKGTTKLLAASDANVLTINGTPMAQFIVDDTHLMFNSDRTQSGGSQTVQIYVITGFTLSVP